MKSSASGWTCDVAFLVERVKHCLDGMGEALSGLVCTVRALKMHGGGPVVTAGKPLDHAYTNEDAALVKAGTCNLAKHVANTRKYGVPVIVAINKFATDTETELAAVREAALEAGMTLLMPALHL